MAWDSYRSLQNTRHKFRSPKYLTFVSYTSREIELNDILDFFDFVCRILRERFDVRLIPIFFDRLQLDRRVYGDQELKNHLETALSESAFVTAFLSPNYFESDWCRYEWNMTAQRIRTPFPILPVLWKEPVTIPFPERDSPGFGTYKDSKGELFCGRRPHGVGLPLRINEYSAFDRIERFPIGARRRPSECLVEAAQDLLRYIAWTGISSSEIRSVESDFEKTLILRREPEVRLDFNSHKEQEDYWNQDFWGGLRNGAPPGAIR